ncbi:MAG TPA: lipopolysaccharide transport periplasmic protein LptA, partial [Steroidobacteraceae bacterium]|nr:lipopolysaccharide transport periplasmic protein LptA [Steroidobacteraceae bacterium]
PTGLGSCHQPITLDAASSQVDYKSNTVDFRQVVISQCNTRVQADHAHATGLNFTNSRWTFDGNVHIEAEERGTLRSDEAVVEFKDNRITRATVTGKPAEFEQKRADSGQPARGHADEIVYDVTNGTVRLSNDAWLTNGQTEVSGSLLVYNIRGQSLQAGAQTGSGERVHIKIPTGAVQNPGKGEPAKPDGGAPPKPESPP